MRFVRNFLLNVFNSLQDFNFLKKKRVSCKSLNYFTVFFNAIVSNESQSTCFECWHPGAMQTDIINVAEVNDFGNSSTDTFLVGRDGKH